MNYETIFLNGALLGFAAAAGVYLLAFQNAARPNVLPSSATSRFGIEPNRWQKNTARLAFVLFVLATLALSCAFGLLSATHRLASLSLTAGLLLILVVSWLAIFGHLRFKLKLIGAFVAPLATLILLVQSFMLPRELVGAAGEPLQISSLIGVHVVMAVLGQAFAIIACAVSIFYLWQQALLKKKLLNQLPRHLPAIDKLDSLLTLSLWAGFVFITLGLLSGAFYTQMSGQSASNSDLHAGHALEFKVIWAIVIWLWYLATLLARNIFNRSGKRIAQMSLGGFLLLAMTYFGIGFF